MRIHGSEWEVHESLQSEQEKMRACMRSRAYAARVVAATAVMLLGLAGCQEAPMLSPVPSGPAIPVPGPGTNLQVALDCRMDVVARTLTCGPTPSAASLVPAGTSPAVIIGGQNVYLTLAQTATTYDGTTGVLASAITIKNLLSQPMGTADGTTLDPNGVRVFFHTLPAVAAGTGTVTVHNADGTGTFTASGQPYYSYPEIITGNATSSPKTWFFSVPTTVTAFTFQVFVQATLRVETAPLTQPAHAFSGQLIASAHTTCAIRASAGVYCWGENGSGTLGIGDPSSASARPSSAALGPDLTRISISTDGAFTCGLTAAGAAYCWGANLDAQLGDGTTTQRLTPTPVTMPSGVTFASLAAGVAHSCGLTPAGAAYCWGINNSGQLGNGTTTQRSTPTAVTMPSGVAFSSIAAGDVHTCGLTSAGAVYCWGSNGSGQLGDGTITGRLTPTLVTMPNGVAFASLTTGAFHNCGLTAAGRGYCWGAGGSGQLGDGSSSQHSTPTAVATPVGVSFTRLTAGVLITCGLTPAGAAYCWGYNDYGQLGDGTTSGRSSPTPVAMPSDVTFTSLAAGTRHTCGLTSAGAAFCWGINVSGQLGIGTTTQRSTPTAVTMPSGFAFTSLGAGFAHTCGVTSAGATYCWGDNGKGQLGNLSVPAMLFSPSPFLAIRSFDLTQLSLGKGAHVCGLTSAGLAYCWGYNGNGQLGDGTTIQRAAPTAVMVPGGITFATVAAGAYHTCGLTPAGSAACWGANLRGQIGDGTTTQPLVPKGVATPTGVTFASLAAGNEHTCALTSAGMAYCWGANGNSQLGDGTTIQRGTPTAVRMPDGVVFASLAAGGSHTCARTSAGAVYCWGANLNGQLGDGTMNQRTTPTAVAMPAGVTFASIAAGNNHNCGLTSAGVAYCWGDNSNGVGDGAFTPHSTPTAVTMPSGVTFASLAAGYYHTCGLTSVGTSWCWGYNFSGQLGDGTTTHRTTPTVTLAP